MRWHRRFGIATLLVVVATAALWGSRRSQGSLQDLTCGDRVQVRLESRGCFHHEELRFEWDGNGDQFRHESFQLDNREIEHLRATILRSYDGGDVLDQLPAMPTSEAIQNRLRTTYPWVSHPPPIVDSVVLREKFREVALEEDPALSTSSVAIEVDLGGTPPIKASLLDYSGGDWVLVDGSMWPLPRWRISAGAKAWSTSSPATTREIARLFPPGKAPAELWRVDSYLADFLEMQLSPIGARWAEDYFQESYRDWPGFLDFHGRLGEARLKAESSAYGDLTLTLKLQGPGELDEADFCYGLAEGPPREWVSLRERLERVELSISRQNWLVAHAKTHPSEAIRLVPSESYDFVAWEKARLPGRPLCAVEVGPDDGARVLLPGQPGTCALLPFRKDVRFVPGVQPSNRTASDLDHPVSGGVVIQPDGRATYVSFP